MNNDNIKVDSIGSDRAIQNPQDAIEKATGKYNDVVPSIPDAQRLLILPQAPAPSPFSSLSSPAKGGR